jgi:hypothetical protein
MIHQMQHSTKIKIHQNKKTHYNNTNKNAVTLPIACRSFGTIRMPVNNTNDCVSNVDRLCVSANVNTRGNHGACVRVSVV